ncbi:MAG: mevalonate kinase [Anaerolineae bacterium]
MTVASAPGKVILFGEHAVVYGRPAIAVPVTQVQATVEVQEEGRGIRVVAQDLDEVYQVERLPPSHPFRLIVTKTLKRLEIEELPDLTISIRSSIPMARGLGSGAAVSAAMVQALTSHLGGELTLEEISALVYEADVFYHGTPSGIDNTVIVYQKPVYFVKGHEPYTFAVKRPFWLAIADSGVVSPTRIAVGDVRLAWQRDKGRYERLFDAIGTIADQARWAIEEGELEQLGLLMDENQRLLRQIDVSSPELEALIVAARRAGAKGAKLSGAGRGGNMIAIVEEETKGAVVDALKQAGAVAVIVTQVR